MEGRRDGETEGWRDGMREGGEWREGKLMDEFETEGGSERAGGGEEAGKGGTDLMGYG
jgi:hypothetical protein